MTSRAKLQKLKFNRVLLFDNISVQMTPAPPPPERIHFRRRTTGFSNPDGRNRTGIRLEIGVKVKADSSRDVALSFSSRQRLAIGAMQVRLADDVFRRMARRRMQNESQEMTSCFRHDPCAAG
jgi:hypothetical protein